MNDLTRVKRHKVGAPKQTLSHLLHPKPKRSLTSCGFAARRERALVKNQQDVRERW
jgi:hypothetical protein